LGSILVVGEQLLLKFLQSVRKVDMKIIYEGIGWIPSILEWSFQIREKSTIISHFLELSEEEGSHTENIEIFIYSTFYILIKPDKFS
jgi:hypothetical protein